MIKDLKQLKERLDYLLENSNKVFITPHMGPDCDAIGSAIALYMICQKFNKEAYIVIDDDILHIENGVKLIMSELPDTVNIVNLSDALGLMDDDSLLITTDTNKTNLVPFDNFEDFKNIVIIDHHNCDEATIRTDDCYIDVEASSTCEIMYQLLCLFNIKIEHKLEDINIKNNISIANYLLGGIILDTNKLTKHVTSKSMDIVARLMKRGADINYANELFLDDFESDMRVQGLVSQTEWKMFNIGITWNIADLTKIYSKEDLAKAADWLLRYKSTDASFALGFIEPEKVYISARSKGCVNVGEIMRQMDGGGNEYSGATCINTGDIKAIRLKLDNVIRPGYRLKG